ncbi:multidrug resistance-associated protein 1-like [Babylonia areolata]|uniref:multidrug resistance-associated protein 1-like n=1 Tax=Babylonia areolata TaxID=304850 RepID=UPI003FD4A61E
MDNMTQLLNSSWPQLTMCFQSSVLVFVPNGFLWCAMLLYLPYILLSPPGPSLPVTAANTAKTVLSIVLSLLAVLAILTETGTGSTADMPYPTAHYVARFCEGVTYLLAAVLSQLERKRGVLSSGVLFVYWLLLTLVDVVPLYSYILLDFASQDLGRVLLFLLSFALIVTQLCLQACCADLPADHHPRMCPETKATFLSRLTFCWMTRLIMVGFRKPLQEGDLWMLNPRDHSATVVPTLEKSLQQAGAFKQRCSPCGEAKCKTCAHIDASTTFVGPQGQFIPRSNYTCKSMDIVYIFTCSLCHKLCVERREALMNSWDTCREQGAARVWERPGGGGKRGEEGEDQRPTASRNNNGSTEDLMEESIPLLAATSGPPSSYSSMAKEEGQKRGAEGEVTFSLLRVMVRTYYADVLFSYLCKMVSDFLQYLAPLLLSLLITHIRSPEDQPWKGYVIAGVMLAASWCQTSFYHQHYHIAMTTGMRMKTALMATIYKKSLRLNVEGQQSGTVGEVVNLMSVDCQNVQNAMSYTFMVWSIPLQVSIAVYLLWDTLGVSVLAGVALLVVLVPVNGYMAFQQQRLQKENLAWKDRRLKMMNEIVDGMKVLKLYAWETSFQQRVLSLREREMAILKNMAHLNAFSIFLWTCAPYLVTLTTFATYVLKDDDARLDANKAFVTLSLFNILQFPIAFIPEMISFTAKAAVSIRRIEKFLKEGEQDPDTVLRTDNADSAVRIERGLFTWNLKGRSTLHGINLDITEGELVAVVGGVGSGKSSLVSAILGEIERRQGKVVVKGSVAYVPQQAWIQNAPLKSNILFGKQFNAKWYKNVVDACALKPDFDMLPNGDHTEIGDKGINLSGGQRQRVSLARAVYADHDIYLFDDPLSAVDSHVGKHLFRKIISDKGVLRHKTRVLVTHAVHWLPLVDTVILLQEGRIVESGSYLQLMKRDGPLAQFLHTVLSKSEDTDTEDDLEVLELRRRMYEHVESVTSASEGGTSGDDLALHRDAVRSVDSSGTVDSSVTVDGPVTVESGDQGHGAIQACMTEDEQAATGRVKMKVFSSYAGHMGYVWCALIVLAFMAYQVFSVYANFWLSHWTEDPVLLNTTTNVTTSEAVARNHHFLTFYGILGICQAVFISLYAWMCAVRMTHAAGNIHAAVLDSVVHSPISFFDSTPSGRIVNRFARDVDTVDDTLPQIIFMFVMCVFSVTSTLVVISVNTPVFMSIILPLAIAYYGLQRFFVPTSRQLKRLEAVTRSPIFSHFGETLAGVSVIRAFQATERFVKEALVRIDRNQVFYFAGITANRWLGVWVEVLSSCVVFTATLFSLLTPGVSAGKAGLSITYAMEVTQALKWLVRSVSDLETNVVSVERLQEYSDLKPEAPALMPVRPRVTWPSHGNIIFTNYSTRYRPGLDLVLKGVNINIRGGEKVGIVGRTGAGKSSLTLALFRLIEPVTGTITIDGLDAASLVLRDLRSRLTVLPQDPVLFSGSLRMNLDPFGNFSDRELWDSLRLAHLLPFVRNQPQGLEYECGEGGRNLSMGQRQLVCLARGLLRKTRILVLDEPTAAVDPETDLLIQGTIRRDFGDCTTLTIAHRLNTIMDYDRVLVMDGGRVKEFDKPSILLQNEDSTFFHLAQDAGLVIGKASRDKE